MCVCVCVCVTRPANRVLIMGGDDIMQKTTSEKVTIVNRCVLQSYT